MWAREQHSPCVPACGREFDSRYKLVILLGATSLLEQVFVPEQSDFGKFKSVVTGVNCD